MMNFKKPISKQQRGQAMVEYAILLILMITLIMGGLELSVTAYNSKKTGDAAEAGANAWAEAIGFSKGNPIESANLTTGSFELMLEREREALLIDTKGTLSYNATGFISDQTCNFLPQPVTNPCIGLNPDGIDDLVRPVLDLDCDHRNNPDFISGFYSNVLPIDITACDEGKLGFKSGIQNLVNTLFPSSSFRRLDITSDFITICTSRSNPEGIEKVITCRDLVDNRGFGPIDLNNDGDTNDVANEDVNHNDILDTEDVNGNNILDPGEDINGNGRIDNEDTLGNRDGFLTVLLDIRSPEDLNNDGVLNREDANNNGILDIGEDANLNGILDHEPDPDGNGFLTPATETTMGGTLDGVDDNDPSYRKLLVRKDLRNTVSFNGATAAVTPIQNGVVKRTSLGDHNPTIFVRPSCNTLGSSASVNDYINGLPDSTSIYLFNPLPIDITDCTGEDAARNNTSRASILVGGFTNNANAALNIEGLPALNQAMYSQYSRVCVNLAGDLSNPRITIVSCKNFRTDALNRIWLKPPGKMCGARFGGEVCPDLDDVEGDGDLVISNFKGATGFYYFGRTNDAVNSALTPTQIYNTYRPAFQIVCDDASSQDANTDAGGACLANGTGSFALEVHTRYRSIFESFLTFGFNRLANANLAQYFYNPNGVGTSGAVVGAAGSELGPVNNLNDKIPSLKKIKDFRGCYRVDISPPDKIGEQVKTAVSSCN